MSNEGIDPHGSGCEQVLVITDAYGIPGQRWCQVIEIVGGDASTYPVRVRIPGGGVGQFRRSEVIEWRG
jgi:hypothetical protein